VPSAVVNMPQQIGAALGISAMTAVFTAVAGAKAPQADSALTAAATDPAAAARAAEALTAGYSAAFMAGAVLLLVAAVVVGWAVNTHEVQKTAAAAAP
jgi:hypothetical protein